MITANHQEHLSNQTIFVQTNYNTRQMLTAFWGEPEKLNSLTESYNLYHAYGHAVALNLHFHSSLSIKAVE